RIQGDGFAQISFHLGIVARPASVCDKVCAQIARHRVLGIERYGFGGRSERCVALTAKKLSQRQVLVRKREIRIQLRGLCERRLRFLYPAADGEESAPVSVHLSIGKSADAEIRRWQFGGSFHQIERK